jgi:hypothetical protein
VVQDEGQKRAKVSSVIRSHGYSWICMGDEKQQPAWFIMLEYISQKYSVPAAFVSAIIGFDDFCGSKRIRRDDHW